MPFKKGQSGNPTGRKRGTFSIKGMLTEKLKEAKNGGINRLDEFCEMMITEAIAGNHHWGAMLLDRFEGKVVEKVEMEIILPKTYAEAVALSKQRLSTPRFAIEKPSSVDSGEVLDAELGLDEPKDEKTP